MTSRRAFLTRNSRSLVRQTIAIMVTAQLLGAAMLCATALLHERHTRLRALDIRLEGRADSLLGAIQDAEDPDDTVTIDPAELHLPEEDVYAVYNQGGRLLGSSRGAPSLLTARQNDAFHDARLGQTRYRVLQREAMRIIDRAENGGVGLRRPVTIVYASPENRLWHEIFEAVRFYLLAIACATGLSVALVAWLLQKTLQPLTALAVAAGQISPPDLTFAAPASVLQVRELRPLAEVLTHAATRLREAFTREQRFVSDAAHELKTAIAVVRSSVQLLMLKRRTPDEYAAGLERVLVDNSRVEALVARMLQLASLEEVAAEEAQSAQTKHWPPGSQLDSLAAETLKQLRPFAEERGVLLQLANSPVLPVRLAPERGLILLSNLVMNAVQHSPAGATVSVSVMGRQPGKVVLQVQDAGEGIAADALPHIFERFYREDRSRSRDTGGTGLGLSICKSIVQAAGGAIAVESARGQGTCVSVTFSAA